jgi:hypothetical protein
MLITFNIGVLPGSGKAIWVGTWTLSVDQELWISKGRSIFGLTYPLGAFVWRVVYDAVSLGLVGFLQLYFVIVDTLRRSLLLCCLLVSGLRCPIVYVLVPGNRAILQRRHQLGVCAIHLV